MDVMNKYGVATNGERVAVLLPPRGDMTNEEAIIFAAWLVTLADPAGEKFAEILAAVHNT